MSLVGRRVEGAAGRGPFPRPLFRLEELLETRFEAARDELVERHGGSWVAIARDGVVAVSPSRAAAEADALEWCAPGTFIVRPVTRARHPSTRLVASGRT